MNTLTQDIIISSYDWNGILTELVEITVCIDYCAGSCCYN